MPLAYVICTSPRSGSTLLCQGLSKTGRAGMPEEFFDHREQVTRYWMKRFGIGERSGFADKIVEATSTPNGVFGAKLHWTTHADMHRALSESLGQLVSDAPRRSLNELLLAKFSPVRYIWLRRQNKVAQGISHFRATRSDFWQIPKGRLGDEKRAIYDAVEFDFRAIDRTIAWAYEYDRQWANYFRHHGLTPLQLAYEDLVASYDAIIRKVLDFLDIPHFDVAEVEPPLERMADQKSFEWGEQYREIVAGNAAKLRLRDTRV
jgi:trehalose 2-sulfotransferase